MTKVAFLGTGLLGSGMAERMLALGGVELTAWNRTEKKARALETHGARVTTSPEAAVTGAERVHLALQDDAAVDPVLERIAGALSAGALVIDHSTTLPAATAERMTRQTARGVRFLHAPVFMSPEMCRQGKGLMLVSGAAANFEAARPVLERMTGQVWYLGDRPDLAASYKLFGNAMLLVIVTGFADLFTMARSAGIAPQDVLGLFSKFPAWIGGSIRGERMARGDFESAFALTMARKDVRLMIEMAAGAPLAVLPGVAARMDAAIAAGRGADDVCVIGAAPTE
jgi:3-hydroxyisobutyrate dehydrogenase-like beta-hydroxyacid dehydrogenase